MNWCIAAAIGFLGLAFGSNPLLAGETAEAQPNATAESAPEYTVSPPRDFADVKLATAGRASRQAVAVNPKNSNVVVTVFRASGSCWARTSTNAGQTWGASKKLPMLLGKPNCNVPAVMWAPDGSRVYASYSYRIPYPSEPDYTLETGALLSYSTDKGLTWSRPKPVFVSEDPYGFILSLTLAAPLRSSDAKWVYLLSDINAGKTGGETFFNRSADRGQTWSAIQWLEGHEVETTIWTSIAGGLGGEVLVSWGRDAPYDDLPSRHIEIRRSSDFGGSFSPAFVVRSDTAGDTAVAFGNAGTAHLVYNQRDRYSIAGKPLYVYSNSAPYSTWSSPVSLSDDISASGYSAPAVSISGCGAASVLHVVWMDDRAGAGEYNTFYTRKVAKNGETWSPNMRISDAPGRPAYPWTVAGIAAGTGTAIGVWGERAAPGASLIPGPTWATRITTGVSCP